MYVDEKLRLDLFLVKHNLVASRQKAQELIKQGFVTIDGEVAMKSSVTIDSQVIKVEAPQQYVGRGTRKMLGFLDSSTLDVGGKLCLDAGASTGGFCEALLLKGAQKVVCVDVGSDQLFATLREDERVESYERTDLGSFSYPQVFDIAVCDLSFTSVVPFLPVMDALVKGDIVILFKPQFESGINAKRTKNGVVTDERAIAAAKERFLQRSRELGWRLVEHEACVLTGKEGNLEWFYRFDNR